MRPLARIVTSVPFPPKGWRQLMHSCSTFAAMCICATAGAQDTKPNMSMDLDSVKASLCYHAAFLIGEKGRYAAADIPIIQLALNLSP